MNELVRIRFELAKNMLQVHGVDRHEWLAWCKRASRALAVGTDGAKPPGCERPRMVLAVLREGTTTDRT